MMEKEIFRGRVKSLEQLMQSQLGVRARTLEKAFARAGRRLPKRIRRAGKVITDAQAVHQHPKLARLHDPKALNTAFADVTAHLQALDPADRRKGAMLGVLGGLVFNLIVLLAAIVVLLLWQGVI